MVETPSKLIVHPTDRTAASGDAFAHALRIAIATKSELHILHVEEGRESFDWNPFAEARDMLAKWGMADANASQDSVAERLGVRIVKAEVKGKDPAQAIAAYVKPRGCDLLVMMTHTRRVLQRWLEGSVAETAAREAHAPALFLREGQRGFVDRATGALSLNIALMPIEASISPLPAFRRVADLAHMLDPAAEVLMLHVGEDLPLFDGLLPHIELRQGPLVGTILSYADEVGANLIAMPTREDRGLFDELLGGATEHVLHASPYPVLAIPVRKSRA
jgi:nucleotide-binding universal stress UspA family protein